MSSKRKFTIRDVYGWWKRRSKLGIVLGGGGTKGSFQVGALHYYYSKSNSFKPYAIIGTSVGAINGIKLAEGEGTIPSPGHTHYMGFEGLQKLWIELKDEHDIVKEEDAFKEIFGSITNISGNIMQFDGFGKYITLAKFLVVSDYAGSVATVSKVIELILKYGVSKLVAGGAALSFLISGFGALGMFFGAISGLLHFLSFNELKGVVDDFTKLIKSQGFLNLSPIEEKMRGIFNGQYIPNHEEINIEKLKYSEILFYATLVEMNSGKLRYVDKFGRLYERDLKQHIKNIDVIDGVIASSSQPVIHIPKEIDGDIYVDGGIMEAVPIKAAFDIGCTSVIAIIPFTPISELQEEDRLRLKNESVTLPDDSQIEAEKSIISEIALRTVDLFLEEVKEGDIHPMDGWKKPVVIIRPEIQVHDGMTIDPGLIRINMNYGHMRAYEIDKKVNPGENGEFSSTALARLRQETWIKEEILFEKIINLKFSLEDMKKYITPHWGIEGPEHREINMNELIAEIRALKGEVRNEVENRRTNEGLESMYYFTIDSEPSSWYNRWEKHATKGPAANNPFEGFSDGPVYVSFLGRSEDEEDIEKVEVRRYPPNENDSDLLFYYSATIKYDSTA